MNKSLIALLILIMAGATFAFLRHHPSTPIIEDAPAQLAGPQISFINFNNDTKIEIINAQLQSTNITINNPYKIQRWQDLSAKTTFLIQNPATNDKIEIDWMRGASLSAKISGLPPRTNVQWSVNDKNLERIASDWAGRITLDLPEYQQNSYICLTLISAQSQKICHGQNMGGII